MNRIQNELSSELLPGAVQILGVNAFGHESGNTAACTGRQLPWLQDDGTTDAWSLWTVTWRDVVILDKHQDVFAVYSLTSHDLGVPANREELKQILRNATAR